MYTGNRVLVVDDEPLIASLVADWLMELGCEVVGPVATVAAALDILGASPPQAVLLDVRLGDGDSFTLADALAAQGVPFAFMTGGDAQSLPAAYRNRPMLGKPFDLETMSSLLGRLLAEPPGAAPTAG